MSSLVLMGDLDNNQDDMISLCINGVKFEGWGQLIEGFGGLTRDLKSGYRDLYHFNFDDSSKNLSLTSPPALWKHKTKSGLHCLCSVFLTLLQLQQINCE